MYPKENMTLIDFKVTVSNIKFKIPGTSSGQASVFSFIVLDRTLYWTDIKLVPQIPILYSTFTEIPSVV